MLGSRRDATVQRIVSASRKLTGYLRSGQRGIGRRPVFINIGGRVALRVADTLAYEEQHRLLQYLAGNIPGCQIEA